MTLPAGRGGAAGRVSSISTPVLISAASTSSTEAEGFLDLSTAHAPAVWGAAIEVPLKKAYASPGREELMDDPGARSEMKEAMFEKLETASAFVVDPTLMAVEMHAGAAIASRYPEFAEAMTVAIPTERRLSMASLRRSVSQLLVFCPPPKLMLTEAIV